VRYEQAVFGFLGALWSGRGCRLYLRFSRGRGLIICAAGEPTGDDADIDDSLEGVSRSKDSDRGNPRKVAISRCKARR
jgi:hypothetical protein